MSDAAAAVGQNGANGGRAALNITDIRRSIERYNEAQQVLNEELFGPVQNDSLIIVVQVRHSLLPLCLHSTRSAYCEPPVLSGRPLLATVCILKIQTVQYP